MKNLIFLFSGQGSQYFGMAKDLYDNNRTFHDRLDALDAIFLQKTNCSFLTYIYQTERMSKQSCDDLLFTHGAIFSIEYTLAQILIEAGFVPNHLIGYSLGEYVSLCISKVLTPEQALDILVKQATSIMKNSELGKMVAILHNTKLYYDSPYLMELGQIGSVNYEDHFVLSGPLKNMQDAMKYLKETRSYYQPLPVNYAFHSSYIEPIRNLFLDEVKNISYQKPQIPVFSCAYQKVLDEIPENYLWHIVRQPVYFDSAIRKMESISNDNVYLDLGIGGTLANFVHRIIGKEAASECMTVISPFRGDLKRYDEMYQRLTTLRQNGELE